MMRWLFLKNLGFVTGAASACSRENARNQRKMLKKNMYEQNETPGTSEKERRAYLFLQATTKFSVRSV